MERKDRRSTAKPSGKRPFRAVSVTLLLVSLLWKVAPAAGDESPAAGADVVFDDPERGVRLSYPPLFVPVYTGRRDVVIALAARPGPFPTFNLVVRPGPYRPTSNEAHADDVVASYHSVGLTGAVLKALVPLRTADGELPLLGVKVAYSDRGARLVSTVAAVSPGQDFHLIATFIDEEASAERSAGLLDHVLGSLSVARSGDGAAAGQDEARNTDVRRALLLCVVLAVMIASVAIVRVVRKEV